MDACQVLDACKTRGVELTAAGNNLRIRAPAGAMDDDLREHLRANKAHLVRLILAACPGCGRPTDDKRRCWRCHDRGCERCGRPTGSAFLATCCVCDLTGVTG